jgi:hypothetical protein
MEDIVKGKLGDEGQYDVDLKEGKIVLSLSYDLGALLDKVAAKVDKPIVTGIVGVLKVALKAV